MNTLRIAIALTYIGYLTFPLAAADLAKIERKIAKEPVYKSKAKYCLLVFGPEAKTHVWLVQDGDTLYVDRNANGDLTEAGKKVTAKKGDYTNAEEGIFTFEAGDISVGPLLHKNLHLSIIKLDYLTDRDEDAKVYLAKDPKARGYMLGIDIEMPGRQGKGLGGRVEQGVCIRDMNGILKFADRPENAPIIHFGGPFQITLFDRPHITIDRQTDLVLGLGTAGLGAGTTAYFGYEKLVPENVHPKVEFTYPPSRPGDTPIKELYELKERC
jgi:hypothetical protein